MIDMSVLDGLIRNTRGNLEVAMRKGYNQGYRDGQADANASNDKEEEAYHKGLKEAWEMAKIIQSQPMKIPYEVFGLRTSNGAYSSPLNAGETITPEEVIELATAYLEKRKRFCNFIHKPCPYEIECEVYCSYDRACKRSEV